VSLSPCEAARPTPGGVVRITTRPADTGGWDVELTVDGQVAAIHHCVDWHRAERHQALLEDQHIHVHFEPNAVTVRQRETRQLPWIV
jgi:hypothetical protein